MTKRKKDTDTEKQRQNRKDKERSWHKELDRDNDFVAYNWFIIISRLLISDCKWVFWKEGLPLLVDWCMWINLNLNKIRGDLPFTYYRR